MDGLILGAMRVAHNITKYNVQGVVAFCFHKRLFGKNGDVSPKAEFKNEL